MAPVILGGSTRYLKRPLFTVLIHLGCDRCGKTTIQKMCRKKGKKIERSGTFFMDGYELGFQIWGMYFWIVFLGPPGPFLGGPQQIPQTLHSSPSSKFTSSLLHSQRGLQHLLSSFYLIKRFPMKCCKITSGTTHPTDLVWFLSAAKERSHRFTSHIPCPRWHFDQQFRPSHLSALGGWWNSSWNRHQTQPI